MKYIDKNPLRDCFDEYTRKYLRDAFQEGKFSPKLASTTTYENFSKTEYKDTAIPASSTYNGWLNVLFAEQHNLCCYCMRRIDRNSVSVEHLIPERLPKGKENEEYEFYANLSPEIREHVMTGHVFDKLAENQAIEIDELQNMPHLIAHSNLFPACSTKSHGCCCNNHRGKERILPVMLMEDIESHVIYREEGELEFNYDENTKKGKMAAKTLEHLDINSVPLKLIRKLWYKFSRKRMFVEWNDPISYQKMDDMVRRALELTIDDVIPLEYQDLMAEEKDGKLLNFSVFLQYNWFYDYYIQKYP